MVPRGMFNLKWPLWPHTIEGHPMDHNTMGCLITDLAGTLLVPEEREMLAHPLVGGVVLFKRNYESPAQLRALCQQIRRSRNRPLLIVADQEGGSVQRFVEGFSALPSMAEIGKRYDEAPDAACHFAKATGKLMASELLSVDIDLSLAPVLDLGKGASPAIGTRAFHACPHAVLGLALAYIGGMGEAGMASVGKHFPGHGSVKADSHRTLPRDERCYHELLEEDLVPFIGVIAADVPALMAAHIVFPQVDALPVGYSRQWLHDILRSRLRFRGAVWSDDLNMEGANVCNDFVERAELARAAGCDFVLVCNNRPAALRIIDCLPYGHHQVSQEKWQRLQGKRQAQNSNISVI